MPTYISLIRFTEQGRKRISTTVERTRLACDAVERAGGHVRLALWTQGQYDQVAVNEWPDEQSAVAFSYRLALIGDVTIESLRAFEACEIGRIVSGLPPSAATFVVDLGGLRTQSGLDPRLRLGAAARP